MAISVYNNILTRPHTSNFCVNICLYFGQLDRWISHDYGITVVRLVWVNDLKNNY